MKNKNVDIIIPIYNSLNWLKICVEAILKNTSREVIHKIYLSNDCSTEDVMPYLEKVKEENPTIIEVINHKKNLGFVKTCNEAMKKSTAKYVLLLNSDCVVSKDAIEKMRNAMSKDDKIGLLCPISSVAANLSYPIPEGMNFMQVNEVFGKQFKGKILDACTVVGNCLMISRKNIEKVGVFDTIFGKGYTEETDYQFKSMQKGFKAKVLLDTYVYHQSRVSFGESPEQLQIRAEHLELFFKRWYDEYMKLMAKYKKHDPIVYIKEKVDYSSVKEDYTITVKKLEDLEIVSNMVNKLMLEGINVRVKVRKKVLKQMNGIMLFNPTIKKGL